MSNSNNNQQPYSNLGNYLKQSRQKKNESIIDVSSAVEIEPSDLERIELGKDRPSEDILILLINHFDLKDNEALNVWKMANYDDISLFENMSIGSMPKSDTQMGTNILMVMPFESRALYSDNFEVIVGQSGLVFNFNQNLPNNQTIPVSRIGVSLDQAANILKAIEKSLLNIKYNTGPKKLNSPKNSKKSDSK